MANCDYTGPSGNQCQESAVDGGRVCFWHDKEADKTGPEIKLQLEALVSSKVSLEGYELAKAELAGAHLVEADLSFANLARANLAGGHLYGTNLKGATLFRVNFDHANLKGANMEDTDLLKANVAGAVLERSTWGPKHMLRNHREAGTLAAQGDTAGSVAKYEAAEDAYRNIRCRFEELGLNDVAGPFFYGEMYSRRKQMTPNSLERVLSKFFDLLCGYGEKPSRIIVASWVYILVNAIIFFFAGFQGGGAEYAVQLNGTALENLEAFGLSLYFSVVTYTTLGYGDFSPIGWAKPFAALEAYNGIILNTLFMLTFFRKMTR